MKRLPMSTVLFVCLSVSDALTAQTFDYFFELEGPASTGVIRGEPGETVEVSGFATIDASDFGIGALTSSFEIRSPDGADFCIDVATTEGCQRDCKEALLGVPLLVIFRDQQALVIQNSDAGCANGLGDPDDPNNMGRRGIIDVILIQVADRLPVGRSRMVPFKVSVVVPEDEAGVAIDLDFVDGLRALGQPIRNIVSFRGSSTPPTVHDYSFRVVPAVLGVSIEGEEEVLFGSGGAPSSLATIRVRSIAELSGLTGFEYSLSYTDNLEVSGASVSSELLDALEISSAEFQLIEFSPLAVDPGDVFMGEAPADPECELDTGLPQGKALVAVVDLVAPGSAGLSLPAGESVGSLDIDFGTVTPTETVETGRFSWRNCHRGSGARVKTGLAVGGEVERDLIRDDFEVTFINEDGPLDALAFLVSGYPRIVVPSGGTGSGQATIVIRSGPEREEVLGFQLSLGYSDQISVTGVAVRDDFLDRIPGVSEPVFQSIDFSPAGVDPDIVFSPGGAAEPDCDLVPGQGQGPGLVANILLSDVPDTFLDLARLREFPTVDIDFMQSDGFSNADEPDQTAEFLWRDCLEGTAGQAKSELMTTGGVVKRPAREGLAVTFLNDPELIVEYGFDLDAGCGGVVYGFPGDTVEVPVWVTLSSPGPIVTLVIQSIQVASPDGAEFCIDVPTTEGCRVPCREELMGQRVGRSLSFVIQNAENGCENGAGDPDDATNAGRRGIIDVTAFIQDELFFGGRARILPILLSVVVPDVEDGATISLEHVDGLRALGPPAFTTISIDSNTVNVGVMRLGHTLAVSPCSFTVKPSTAQKFVRCDSNDDKRVNIADCIWTLSELMRRGPSTMCKDAADCDEDGTVQIADVMFGLEYQFLGASPPGDPFPECGEHAASTVESCPIGSSNACP